MPRETRLTPLARQAQLHVARYIQQLRESGSAWPDEDLRAMLEVVTNPVDEYDVMRLFRFAVALEPIVGRDPRVEGDLYVGGEAAAFFNPPYRARSSADKPRSDVNRFLAALTRDHRLWLALAARDHGAARWTRETGKPGVDACLEHFDVDRPSRAALYRSWNDYLRRIDPRVAHAYCGRRASNANKWKLMSGYPTMRVAALDVWELMAGARGRCVYCGSLCVEAAPVDPLTKRKAPWATIGRRIGSVEHVTPRVNGGDNGRENLAWACMWCNVYPCCRIPGARDHGGLQRSTGPRSPIVIAPWLTTPGNTEDVRPEPERAPITESMA